MARRVLIFDDDEDLLSICDSILTNLHWEVHTRTNCNHIFETVKNVQPLLILMDNWIPDSGGILATQKIKAHLDFKKIPVIYFSADHEIKRLSAEAGADTYLEKPFDIHEFEKKLIQ